MICYTKESGDYIFVGFPFITVPDEVTKWAEEALDSPQWATLGTNGRRYGIFLTPSDAVVFKLKFG